MISPEAWHDWWESAEDQYEIANHLLLAGRASHAVFHALMALEMAAKAIRATAATWVDIGNASWADIGNAAWADMGPRDPARRSGGHQASEQVDMPWQPRDSARTAQLRIAEVETRLGLQPGALYMASRYPNGGWPGNRGVPYRLVQVEHAESVLSAVLDFLQVCRSYLGTRLGNE